MLSWGYSLVTFWFIHLVCEKQFGPGGGGIFMLGSKWITLSYQCGNSAKVVESGLLKYLSEHKVWRTCKNQLTSFYMSFRSGVKLLDPCWCSDYNTAAVIWKIYIPYPHTPHFNSGGRRVNIMTHRSSWHQSHRLPITFLCDTNHEGVLTKTESSTKGFI